MDVLRFITAGSVDDGKSTLIGRLLYDTDNIKSDILTSVTSDEDEGLNLAFITDGLRAERQQGITIDVAYKYFSSKNRKYIISDAPGHFQYIRNLVTGASGVDVMIILIDACNGITEQTRRHSLVASFLGIKHIVIAINKMDAVGYDEHIYGAIKDEYLQLVEKLQLDAVTFIPISALKGDNVSFNSQNTPWYRGTTLLEFLENCITQDEKQAQPARFSIQYVINLEESIAYAGKVLAGSIKTGDVVILYPQQQQTVVQKIVHGYNEVHEALAGKNICMYLSDSIKVARGNILSHIQHLPFCNNKFEAMICWLDTRATLQIGKKYFLKINSMEVQCCVTEITYSIDNTTFDKQINYEQVSANQFASVKIECVESIAFDLFSIVTENGRGIFIDPETNNTSGAFIIVKSV